MTRAFQCRLRPDGLPRLLAPGLLVLAVLLSVGLLYDPYVPAGPSLLPEGDDWTSAAWRGLDGPSISEEPPGTLALRATTNRTAHVHWQQEGTPSFAMVRVRGQAMSQELAVGDAPWKRGRVVIMYFDGQGKFHWSYPHQAIGLTGDEPWQPFDFVSHAQSFADGWRLTLSNGGRGGVFAVRRLHLQTVRWRAGRRWVQAGLLGLWLAGAARYARRLNVLRRRGGWAVVVLGLLTPVAMLLPASVVDDSPDFTAQVVQRGADQLARLLPARAAPPATPPATQVPSGASPPPAVKPARAVGMAHVTEWIAGLPAHAIGHFSLFFLFTLAVGRCFALFDRGSPRRRWRNVALGCMLFAAAAEALQVIVISRSPSWADWGINIQGVTAAFMLFAVRGLRRNVTGKKTPSALHCNVSTKAANRRFHG